MSTSRQHTYHEDNRQAASAREQQLERVGAAFETHHEPWDYQPYRIVATLPGKHEERRAFP